MIANIDPDNSGGDLAAYHVNEIDILRGTLFAIFMGCTEMMTKGDCEKCAPHFAKIAQMAYNPIAHILEKAGAV